MYFILFYFMVAKDYGFFFWFDRKFEFLKDYWEVLNENFKFEEVTWKF